jgi:anti-sigma factor RsiW
VWAALAPDGELAVLERRLLDAHLAHCARCRAFAQQVAAVAAAVRGAAAELCRVHVALGCRLASSATNRPERALR